MPRRRGLELGGGTILNDNFHSIMTCKKTNNRRSQDSRDFIGFFSRFSETILEEDFGIRDLRARSVTHGNEMSFQDFADLFKIFRYFTINISHCAFLQSQI